MKKNNLANEDGTLKFEDIKKFLDKFAETNPDFKSAIEKTKDCVREDLQGPPNVCLADRLVHCVGVTIMTECPASQWQQTDGCKLLKEHMEECKPFFFKKN